MLWTVQEALCLERMLQLSKELQTIKGPGWERRGTELVIEACKEYGTGLDVIALLKRSGIHVERTRRFKPDAGGWCLEPADVAPETLPWDWKPEER